MPAFTYTVDPDGIAVLTFDLPNEKVNKLTSPVMEELDRMLGHLAADRTIRALVLRSGKSGSFIVGADIAEINAVTDPAQGRELAVKGQSVFSRLESLPFPTIGAIHGPCMGGGLELALSCTYRVISDDPRTVLALPEVKLGIVPGFGGTQRLPRLIGLQAALPLILTGSSVRPKQAKRTGLADIVTHPETLLAQAIGLAKRAAKRPRERAVPLRRPILSRLIDSNPATRALLFAIARRRVLRETKGHYPAPLRALDAVRTGLSRGREAGFHEEARAIGELAPSEVSKNLISVYYLNETLKKDPKPSPLSVKNAAVLGAGIMGGGIAQLFSERGIAVRMKDINPTAVGAGLRAAFGIFSKRRKKGVLSAIEARDGMDRITGTTEYAGFMAVDIAVEAVVESMDVKKAVLRDFEQASRPDIVYASNTSSLSISELAKASGQPDRVAGMHFFNPVEKMPLVEIVRGKETSPETIDAIVTLSRRLGKLPVVVNDGPGFLVNRILMPYLNEAAVMLEQGLTVERIDEALLAFGMPMGAFILLDEIGIDVAHKVADILRAGLGERVAPSPLLEAMHRDKRLGRKTGRGFYLYSGGKRGKPDSAVSGVIAASPSLKVSSMSNEDIVERPVLLMIKEAALCIEDRIIDRPDLLDAALIFGIGFPPFLGGLLRYADRLDIRAVVSRLDVLADQHGERFSPPHLLRDMADSGKGFYSPSRV